MQEEVLEDDEVMVSYDVTALFPSIDALIEYEKYLKEIKVPVEKSKIYLEAAKTCMGQNYFQFRNVFYKVEHGTNIGNPLSPLISNCQMSALENRIKHLNLFPKYFARYVDDCFGVVKRKNLEETLKLLNSQLLSS